MKRVISSTNTIDDKQTDAAAICQNYGYTLEELFENSVTGNVTIEISEPKGYPRIVYRRDAREFMLDIRKTQFTDIAAMKAISSAIMNGAKCIEELRMLLGPIKHRSEE